MKPFPWLLLGCAGLACSESKSFPQGPVELFRVRSAQFVSGGLPGTLPPDGGAPAPDADAGDAGDDGGNGPPQITAFESLGRVAYQGQGGIKFNGRATDQAFAVGLAMADAGDGYWVVPIGAPDPTLPELTWDATCDLGLDLVPGYHDVSVVAIDQQGRAGRQLAFPLCVASRVPDNWNACEHSLAPPDAVISLQWDTNVDLDLQVVAPDGTVIDAKRHPTTAPVDDAGALPPGAGSIDRDSNGGCVIDNIRFENLVWNTARPQGRYGIYVNLFAACGQPSVRFEVSVWTSVPDADGGQVLHEWYRQGGEILDVQANGGTARGLFISEFVFQ